VIHETKPKINLSVYVLKILLHFLCCIIKLVRVSKVCSDFDEFICHIFTYFHCWSFFCCVNLLYMTNPTVWWSLSDSAWSAGKIWCLHHEAEERNHFLFVNKCFNTQRNLTKFSTLIVNEYYHRCYLLNSGNYTNFCRILCRKCDIAYYVT